MLVREAQRFRDGVGAGAKQARHFPGRLQMPFGIGLKPRAGRLQGDMLADAGDDILQFALVGLVIERVIDRDQRHLCSRAPASADALQAAAVFAGVKHGGRQPGIGPRIASAAVCALSGSAGGITISSKPSRYSMQIGEIEKTFAFGRARFAEATAAGKAGHRRRDPADRPECPACRRGRPAARRPAGVAACRGSSFCPGVIGAHHARQAVAVGDADGGIAQRCRLFDELAGMRGAAQEGIIGGDGQFGIAHANMPCRYQRGARPFCRYRPSR